MKDKHIITIESLVAMELKLRRYTHSPQCKAYTECPNKHSICKERLGLDTSMLWELANEVLTLHEYLDTYFKNSVLVRTKDIRSAITRIETLVVAFDAILHRHGYYPLCDTITALYPLLDQVKSLLRKSGGKKGGNV